MTPNLPDLRVAIVEDIRADLEWVLEQLNGAPGMICVATCASAAEALATLPTCQPDVVLMDIQLPDGSGVECVRQLSQMLPETQFMMLTVFHDDEHIFNSLAAGATGYLLKKASGPQLLDAIRELHQGGAPMSCQVARKVVAAFRQPPAASTAAVQLTEIEQLVLDHLARGLLYKEVAERLGKSVGTVRTHIWHIYRKLQAHNRTEAVIKGGLLSSPAAREPAPARSPSPARRPR